MKKTLTIRGLDKTTYETIKEHSQKEHTSMNKFLLNLLRSRLGIIKSEPNREFDAFLGSWNSKEHRDFLKSCQCFEAVDEELWA